MKKITAIIFSLFFAVVAHAVEPVVGVIHVESEFTSVLVSMVDSELAQAKAASATSLIVLIDSPGGGMGSMLKVIKAISDTKLPTVCIVGNQAASAAFVLLQSEACTVRIVRPYSVLLAHLARSADDTPANVTELEERITDLKLYDRVIALRVCGRIGMTPDEYLSKLQNGDWVSLGEDAVANHLADKVIPGGVVVQIGPRS